MTDEDAEYNALMDPDEEPFLTDEDREKIKTLVDPKVIRKRLKLTQVEFAERFAIPLGTLRDWERRARFPDSAARAYLRVISEDPELVCKALKRSYDRMPALTT
jgi:putative transcriptional regulator